MAVLLSSPDDDSGDKEVPAPADLRDMRDMEDVA